VLLPLGGEHFEFHEGALATELILMAISVAVAFFGIFQAYRLYFKDADWTVAKRRAASLKPVYELLQNKYYVDELYNATVIRGTLLFSEFLSLFDRYVIDGLVNLVRHATVYVFGHGSRLFDVYVVDGAVNGVASMARHGSTMFRKMQSGFVQNYAMIMGGGIVLLAAVYLFTKA